MTTRFTPIVPGEFYHVYNRGTDKRIIFHDNADYRRFMELLYLSNCKQPINVRDIKKTRQSVFDFDRGEQLVSIGAYCLMPNHFHLLLTPVEENNAAKFMNKLGTSYSMYFNKRYNRTGALFQGPFKSQLAGRDEYLKYLFAYIHLNPVKLIQKDWKEQGIKDVYKALDHAGSYQYSSLPDYLGFTRPEKAIINPDPFPAYFLTVAATETNLLDWLTYAMPEDRARADAQ